MNELEDVKSNLIWKIDAISNVKRGDIVIFEENGESYERIRGSSAMNTIESMLTAQIGNLGSPLESICVTVSRLNSLGFRVPNQSPRQRRRPLGSSCWTGWSGPVGV
jgi:hypothetical protein